MNHIFPKEKAAATTEITNVTQFIISINHHFINYPNNKDEQSLLPPNLHLLNNLIFS